MRDYWWGISIAIGFFSLLGLTQVHNKYENERNIFNEFQNIYRTVQDRQFKVLSSTPRLTELRDGEMFISSGTAVKFMFRFGQEIYSINTSCVTITR